MRRAALEKGDDIEYKSIVKSKTKEEEMLDQSKLQEIIVKVGLTEKDFIKNMRYHEIKGRF